MIAGLHLEEPALQQPQAQVPLAERCRAEAPQLSLHVRPQQTGHSRRMSSGY